MYYIYYHTSLLPDIVIMILSVSYYMFMVCAITAITNFRAYQLFFITKNSRK